MASNTLSRGSSATTVCAFPRLDVTEPAAGPNTSTVLAAIKAGIKKQLAFAESRLGGAQDDYNRLFVKGFMSGLRTALICLDWEATRPTSKTIAERQEMPQ